MLSRPTNSKNKEKRLLTPQNIAVLSASLAIVSVGQEATADEVREVVPLEVSANNTITNPETGEQYFVPPNREVSFFDSGILSDSGIECPVADESFSTGLLYEVVCDDGVRQVDETPKILKSITSGDYKLLLAVVGANHGWALDHPSYNRPQGIASSVDSLVALEENNQPLKVYGVANFNFNNTSPADGKPQERAYIELYSGELTNEGFTEKPRFYLRIDDSVNISVDAYTTVNSLAIMEINGEKLFTISLENEQDGSASIVRFNLDGTFKDKLDLNIPNGYRINKPMKWVEGQFAVSVTTGMNSSIPYAVTVGAPIEPTDADSDGIPDESDNCPNTPNPGQEDGNNNGVGSACDSSEANPDFDSDGDGIPDERDICPAVPNPDQIDTNNDGEGNACDNDDDGDGVEDIVDNCPVIANPDQENADFDTQGDVCDPCPLDASDECGNEDSDGDGVLDDEDNCPNVANVEQDDLDLDNIGDKCDPDIDGDGIPNGEDMCSYDPGNEPVRFFASQEEGEEESNTQEKAGDVCFTTCDNGDTIEGTTLVECEAPDAFCNQECIETCEIDETQCISSDAGMDPETDPTGDAGTGERDTGDGEGDAGVEPDTPGKVDSVPPTQPKEDKSCTIASVENSSEKNPYEIMLAITAALAMAMRRRRKDKTQA